MKLRILSDLHIEFHPFVIPPQPDDDQTVLVLAGDIGVIRRRTELDAFLRSAAGQFKAVVYVMGNHEYYAGVWPDALKDIQQWTLPENVHILERQCVQIDEIVFVCATLWTDFDQGNPQSMQDAERILNDFHYIRTDIDGPDGLRYVLPEDIAVYHQRSLAWLERTLGELRDASKPCILVTHHGVSRRSIHDTFKDSPVNGAFVSACDELIKRTGPLLAIHGHVHNSFDYRIESERGHTRVLVNPRGYTRADGTQENPFFDPCLTFDTEAVSNEPE